AEPLHEERVVFVRGGIVEEAAQQLVVAGAGHTEFSADRGLLGARLRPPGALEVEDVTIACGQPHQVNQRIALAHRRAGYRRVTPNLSRAASHQAVWSRVWESNPRH